MDGPMELESISDEFDVKPGMRAHAVWKGVRSRIGWANAQRVSLFNYDPATGSCSVEFLAPPAEVPWFEHRAMLEAEQAEALLEADQAEPETDDQAKPKAGSTTKEAPNAKS